MTNKVTYVSLPYNFIPFPDSYVYPYASIEDVPKHDDSNHLSGVITYQIIPYSDLAMEIRRKLYHDYFISGSSIRGKIRSNVEILSASFPEFISRTPLLYRDVTNANYRKRVQSNQDSSRNPQKKKNKNQGIEYSIRVGFLHKIDNEFYVTPAKQIGDKYFLSIKEHRLMQMGLRNKKNRFSFIYSWNEQNKKEFQVIQDEIERKTKLIKSQRKALGELLSHYQTSISKLFTEEFSLRKIGKRLKKANHFDKELDKIYKELNSKLKTIGPRNSKLHELYQLTADRWKLKVKLDYKYSKMKKNGEFSPYQERAFFKPTANHGISTISFNHSPEITESCFVFNSSNANSKRSHYFVLEPDNTKNQYLVPHSVINAYEQNLKKFRTTDSDKNEKTKEFYDIFNGYEKALNLGTGKNGLIVFFKTHYNEKEIEYIGRTPYFKVKHRVQINDLLGNKVDEKVDYANALFGFTPSEEDGEREVKFAYKSRLRFTPVDIIGKCNEEHLREVDNLILMSPFPTASAMYLQQDDGELRTYESAKQDLRLNGYKYYHIFDRIIPTETEGKESFTSSRKVLQHNGLRLRGKIFFNNITREELGLLLLSLDWTEVRNSQKYGNFVRDYAGKFDQAYESIGGAKPYGYGKVKFKIENIEVEKKGYDFSTLVLEPMKDLNQWYEYIDEFITKMGSQNYFHYVNFEHYIQSKMKTKVDNDGNGTKDNPQKVNWGNLPRMIEAKDNKGGGYPKEWRLKTNQNNNN